MQNQWLIIWPHSVSKINRFSVIAVYLAVYPGRYPNNKEPLEWSSEINNSKLLFLESAMWTLEYYINDFNFCNQALYYYLLPHTSICCQECWCIGGCCHVNVSLLSRCHFLHLYCVQAVIVSGGEALHQCFQVKVLWQLAQVVSSIIKDYRLRMWHLCQMFWTDHGHSATEDGWEVKTGLKVLIRLTIIYWFWLEFACVLLLIYPVKRPQIPQNIMQNTLILPSL